MPAARRVESTRSQKSTVSWRRSPRVPGVGVLEGIDTRLPTPHPCTSVPHSPQNLIPGAFANPQLGHLAFSDAPHSPQNFMPLAFSKPQAGQCIDGPGGPPAPIDLPGTTVQARTLH